MYQGFQQGQPSITAGSTLYYFDRNKMDVTLASVVSVSLPHVPKAAQNNPAALYSGLVADVTFSKGDETMTVEFPTGSVFANYPEKGFFLSADILAVDREVDSIENAARQYMAQYPAQQKILESCGPLREKLHPERKKEAQQEEKIASLEAKIDQLISAFAAGSLGKGPAQKRKEE